MASYLSTSDNSDSISLKRCSSCQLIWYCGKFHQKQHWKEHKDLCKAISIIKKTKQISAEHEEDRRFFMSIVESELKRALTEDEKGLFKFQKICFVCNDDDNDNYVSKRRLTKSSRQIEEELFSPAPFVGLIPPHYLTHPWLPKDRRVSASEHLCLPRTFFTALLKLGDFTVPQMLFHVVGACFSNKFINSWESILHWLTKLTFLKIVFFEQMSARSIQYLDLCVMCRFWGEEKKLIVETKTESYKDYLDDFMYQSPKIVTFINVHPPDDDKMHCKRWKKLIRIWNRLTCALVITTETKENSDLIKERLRSDLKSFEIILDCPNKILQTVVDFYDNGAGGKVSEASKFLIVCKPADADDLSK